MSKRLSFDVVTFIEAVKVRPGLYNSKHDNYSGKELKARLWDEVGKVLYPEWESFDLRKKNEKSSLMQRKWRSLKDCFNREIRFQNRANPSKVRKKYEFFDKLSFLLLKQNPEDTEKEVNPETDGRTSDASLDQSFQQSVVTPNRSEIPKSERNSRKRKTEMEEEFLERQKKKSKGKLNPDKLFLISFLDDFSKLPMATKYWVKMKFSEIMHQAAMSLDEYQNSESENAFVDYKQKVGSTAADCMVEDLKKESFSDSSSSYEI